MYKYLKNPRTNQVRTDLILRLSDDANIPNSPGNLDWQKYQDWLADGNTPQAAD